MRFIGPKSDALRNASTAFCAALRCPTSWISLITRCGILILGFTFILRWVHHDEHWTLSHSLHDVVTSPLLIVCLLWFGAVGRAIDDHEFLPAEFIRAVVHQAVVVPTGLALWFVLGAALSSAGAEALGSVILPIACFSYCYRAASFETDRVLAKLPKSETNRGSVAKRNEARGN